MLFALINLATKLDSALWCKVQQHSLGWEWSRMFLSINNFETFYGYVVCREAVPGLSNSRLLNERLTVR